VGEWSYGCTIFDLGSRWRWVISLTPRPLYLQEISSRYPLDRQSLPQSPSRLCGEDKYLSPARIRTPAVQLIVHHYVDWAIPTSLHSVELRKAETKKGTSLGYFLSLPITVLGLFNFQFSSNTQQFKKIAKWSRIYIVMDYLIFLAVITLYWYN
jgi:hypothetical protein